MTEFFTTADQQRIAYSISGTGTALFLVGAPVGMSGFAALAKELSAHYRVVCHDPRGIGLSACEPDILLTPGVLARDLAELIAHLTNGPVLLFGASGGAVTGLELLRRNPGLVKALVAHEAPLFRLLPDDGATLAAANAAFEQAADDPAGGMQAFADLTETLHATYQEMPRPKRIPLPPMTAEEERKNRLFLTRMAGPTVNYLPEREALADMRLAVAAGEASIGQVARRSSLALGELLGKPVANAPGNHFAPTTQPQAFARWLHGMFDAAAGVA